MNSLSMVSLNNKSLLFHKINRIALNQFHVSKNLLKTTYIWNLAIQNYLLLTSVYSYAMKETNANIFKTEVMTTSPSPPNGRPPLKSHPRLMGDSEWEGCPLGGKGRGVPVIIPYV